MEIRSAIAVTQIFVGCFLNNITLEVLTRRDPGCGNLVTLFQFVAISYEGLLFHNFEWGKMRLKKRQLPMKVYFVLTALFGVLSIVNNYALNFNISMPLHMIFRSCSLVASLVIGILAFKKSYALTKILSAMLVTCGIFIATYADAQSKYLDCCDDKTVDVSTKMDVEAEEEDYGRWMIGIALLLFTLVLTAFLGHFQESAYHEYGKHSSEARFYCHALTLPSFIFLLPNVYEHINIVNSMSVTMPSHPLLVSADGNPWEVPLMVFVFLNVFTQYICISGVYSLTSHASTFTTTLTLTCRKFASLLFSIWYFQNPFTFGHWVGSALVLGGAVMFHLFRDGPRKKKQD